MIVALDPGKVTGLATLRPEDVGRPGFFESWQTDTWDAVAWVELRVAHVEAVICEDYIITMQTLKKTRGENWSLESLGALRYMCRKADKPLVVQAPADAKKFSTDTKLKTAKMWHPTPGGHANDAARHLMLYLARTERLGLVLSLGQKEA